MSTMTDTNTERYDVIIVGAGPAGSTAAMYAHRAGLKSLLLDKASFPRDKICGDALSGKSVTILRDLDIMDEVNALPGAYIKRVVFGSPEHVHVNIDFKQDITEESLSGFVIRRTVFDNYLFQKAREAADTVRENFTVTDLVWEDGQVTGVTGRDSQDNKQTFHAPIVLGADGYRSVIARETGLYHHDPAHWVVALRQYYQGVNGLTDQIELHYVDEVLPGYFWIFPLEDGNANVGIGMLHKYIKEEKVNLRQALQHSIESPAFQDRFADATPLENPTGWNLPVGSKHRKNYGNGFMLLGDAAGLIDPFTGEGIGNAMYSARYAIQTISEAMEANDYGEAFLRRYDARLWAEIGDELQVSYRLQKLGKIRPLLNFVIHKAAKSDEVNRIIGGMLANEVPRKKLSNPLFYLKLLFS